MQIKEFVTGEKADIAVLVDEYGGCDVVDFIEKLGEPDQRKVIHLFNMFCAKGEIRNEEKFMHEAGKIFAFKSY